jgi:hypothetical protein
MSQTYREPPEQAKYIQEVKWQKTLWEEGHGFNFPGKEQQEGGEEPLESTMDRRGELKGESSSEESQ